MPVHVQQRGAERFRHVIAFVEMRCVEHAFAQRVRHRFAGLVMAGIVGKYLRMAGPVLIDLRRELNKITRGIGPGQRGVALTGKQAVQRMTKFVEQGYYIIPREQRGASVAGF